VQARLLLERRADPTIRDWSGARPVDVARAAGCRALCLLYRKWERKLGPQPEPHRGAEAGGAAGRGGEAERAVVNLSAAAALREPTAAQVRRSLLLSFIRMKGRGLGLGSSDKVPFRSFAGVTFRAFGFRCAPLGVRVQGGQGRKPPLM
jgi:hypothetical protein